jgi:hypothetical protein
MSRVSAYEYDYAYLLGYQSLFHAIPLAWLKADNRYPLVTGEARAPEAWDTSRRPAVVKLYHGGNHETPDAPYTAYYFRRAELYLMEAELKARLDRFTVPGALAPLNEMRACRENPSLPPLAATTKSELLRLIFQEIWTEQFLENGSEFFAAIRFINDTDASPARGKPWIYTLKQDVNFSENHYCWPIPGFELQKNLKMKPNPGYDQ